MSGDLSSANSRNRTALATSLPVSFEDDLRVIAEHGYEVAASADHDQQAQAVSLFITDVLAASIGQG
jgi:hypothetical protein